MLNYCGVLLALFANSTAKAQVNVSEMHRFAPKTAQNFGTAGQTQHQQLFVNHLGYAKDTLRQLAPRNPTKRKTGKAGIPAFPVIFASSHTAND